MAGDDSYQPPHDTEPPPEDTFALVGHEIRAEIIRALAPGVQLSFSKLRSRLDTDIEPSQLHYHLQQLTGHFVEKTDDGYQLNSVGRRLRLTIRAGSFNCREEYMEVAANFDCYYCQGPVEAIFSKGWVRIVCSECEEKYMVDYNYMPLELYEDEIAAFDQFTQYQTLKMRFLAHKTCPSCANQLSPTFREWNESPLGYHQQLKVVVHVSCNRCGATWWQTVGMALLADPDLRVFCYENGIDVLSTPHWELEFAATDKHVTLRSTDPWEVVLQVTFDDETLEMVVDGELDVVERNCLNAADDKQNKNNVVLPDNGDCLQYLRRHRWPDEVMCPHCDSTDTIKDGTTRRDVQRYKCRGCDSIFNDLTGTIFAGHHLTLPEMFYIIRAMEGVQTAQIAQQLDRSYQAVLNFIHEVQDTHDEDIDFDISGVREADLR